MAALNWAFWDVGQMATAPKLVLIALADYADDRHQCWPAYETLADKTSMGRTSVYNAIKKLAEVGAISITNRYEEGKKISNLYTLNLAWGCQGDTAGVSEGHHLSSHVRTKEADLSSDVRTKETDLSSHVRTKGKTPEKQAPSSDLSSNLSSNLSSDVRTITTRGNHKPEPKTKGEVPDLNLVEFPNELDTPEFRKTWETYEAYRTANKFKRLKPVSVQTKLDEMAGWGHEAAVASIRETIGNGWQGIFAPKSSPSKPSAEGAPKAQEGSAKPLSTWEITKKIEAIEARQKELLKRRAEVAGGDFVWDSPEIKAEYYQLATKRKQLNRELINL